MSKKVVEIDTPLPLDEFAIDLLNVTGEYKQKKEELMNQFNLLPNPPSS